MHVTGLHWNCVKVEISKRLSYTYDRGNIGCDYMGPCDVEIRNPAACKIECDLIILRSIISSPIGGHGCDMILFPTPRD